MKNVQMIPTPVKKLTLLRFAAITLASMHMYKDTIPSHSPKTTIEALTHHIRRPCNVQPIVHHPARQIRRRQRVQRRVLQLSHIADDNCCGEEAEVLKAVLLGTFGADNGRFGGLVNGLVALGVARVCSRVFVVEFAERGGVEVWCDGEHPRRWDGVQGLICALGG